MQRLHVTKKLSLRKKKVDFSVNKIGGLKSLKVFRSFSQLMNLNREDVAIFHLFLVSSELNYGKEAL